MTTKPQPAIRLNIEQLTREAFKPFGDVIEVSEEVEHFTINAGSTERYHNLANIDPGPEGRVIVSIFRGKPYRSTISIQMMERHPLASQAFVPMSQEHYLVVVAPSGPAPASTDLRAFLARSDQGVNYAPGVWHHPLLALNNVSNFLVIDRKGPDDNCDEIQLNIPAILDLSDIDQDIHSYQSA